MPRTSTWGFLSAFSRAPEWLGRGALAGGAASASTGGRPTSCGRLRWRKKNSTATASTTPAEDRKAMRQSCVNR
ncbi:Uncharacterised protein [Acinetobacter baumannii]|nr:Uncharacterised protein [Acinetobacter baumannii]